MATLTIKTADELMALDLQERWRARRETQVSKQVLRAFLDHGGPIPAEHIAAAFRDTPAAAIHQALAALDHDDLLRVRDGQIDVAYPFTASPTPFVIRLPGGAERFACCATDALGIAPMVGQAVKILSRCHHCQEPMEFAASPEGPDRAPTASCSGSGRVPTTAAGSPTTTERPSTSSGRKTI